MRRLSVLQLLLLLQFLLLGLGNGLDTLTALALLEAKVKSQHLIRTPILCTYTTRF